MNKEKQKELEILKRIRKAKRNKYRNNWNKIEYKKNIEPIDDLHINKNKILYNWIKFSLSINNTLKHKTFLQVQDQN